MNVVVYETNCLVVKWEILRDVFGEMYWNDTESIICVPTDRITDDEWYSLEVNHEIKGGRKAQYLIAEL